MYRLSITFHQYIVHPYTQDGTSTDGPASANVVFRRWAGRWQQLGRSSSQDVLPPSPRSSGRSGESDHWLQSSLRPLPSAAPPGRTLWDSSRWPWVCFQPEAAKRAGEKHSVQFQAIFLGSYLKISGGRSRVGRLCGSSPRFLEEGGDESWKSGCSHTTGQSSFKTLTQPNHHHWCG